MEVWERGVMEVWERGVRIVDYDYEHDYEHEHEHEIAAYSIVHSSYGRAAAGRGFETATSKIFPRRVRRTRNS